MTHCVYQLNASSAAACEDVKASVPISSERRDFVVCPKPRRLQAANDPIKSLRWQLTHQSELCDSKAGSELMDIILSKGGYGGSEQSSAAQAASSPPFFCGSPPSRATNPLIQDARFGEEKITPLSPLSIPVTANSGFSSSSPPSPSPSPSPSSTRKGGSCVRAKFGHKPAAVRIEGFESIDRDRRSCSIPAVA